MEQIKKLFSYQIVSFLNLVKSCFYIIFIISPHKFQPINMYMGTHYTPHTFS